MASKGRGALKVIGLVLVSIVGSLGVYAILFAAGIVIDVWASKPECDAIYAREEKELKKYQTDIKKFSSDPQVRKWVQKNGDVARPVPGQCGADKYGNDDEQVESSIA